MSLVSISKMLQEQMQKAVPSETPAWLRDYGQNWGTQPTPSSGSLQTDLLRKEAVSTPSPVSAATLVAQPQETSSGSKMKDIAIIAGILILVSVVAYQFWK